MSSSSSLKFPILEKTQIQTKLEEQLSSNTSNNSNKNRTKKIKSKKIKKQKKQQKKESGIEKRKIKFSNRDYFGDFSTSKKDVKCTLYEMKTLRMLNDKGLPLVKSPKIRLHHLWSFIYFIFLNNPTKPYFKNMTENFMGRQRASARNFIKEINREILRSNKKSLKELRKNKKLYETQLSKKITKEDLYKFLVRRRKSGVKNPLLKFLKPNVKINEKNIDMPNNTKAIVNKKGKKILIDEDVYKKMKEVVDTAEKNLEKMGPQTSSQVKLEPKINIKSQGNITREGNTRDVFNTPNSNKEKVKIDVMINVKKPKNNTKLNNV